MNALFFFSFRFYTLLPLGDGSIIALSLGKCNCGSSYYGWHASILDIACRLVHIPRASSSRGQMRNVRIEFVSVVSELGSSWVPG